MLKPIKLALVAIVVCGLLASAVNAASANRLSVDEARIRITWASLEFVSEFGTGRCPLTIEGSFHSATIRKTFRALLGYISRATFHHDACTGVAKARIAQEALPWHITYEGFRGTLPDITHLRLLLREPKIILDEIPIIGSCTARILNWAFELETGVREAGGAFKPDNVIPDSTIRVPCGGFTKVFEGTGRLKKLGSTARLLLRLI